MENFFIQLHSILSNHAWLISVGYVLVPLIVVRWSKGLVNRSTREKSLYFPLVSIALIILGITGSFFLAALQIDCDSATILDRCEGNFDYLLQRDAAGRPLFWATFNEFYRWLFASTHFLTTPVIILGCMTLLIKLVRK